MSLIVTERTMSQAILKRWGLDRDVTATEYHGGGIELKGVSAFKGTLQCAIGEIKALGFKVRNMVHAPHLV